MMFIIFIILILYIIYKLIRYLNKNVDDSARDNNITYQVSLDNRESSEEDDYYLNYESKENAYIADEGYSNFELKGVYYRHLPASEIRNFKGCAVAEDNNQYDQYAVAIYNENMVHVGYAPGGYYSLHEFIKKQGGKVPAYGSIWKDNGRTFGRVNILFNPNHFYDDVPEEERFYKKPNLKSYQFYSNETAIKGKFSGYAVLGDKFNFDIFNDDNIKIGEVFDEEYLYNTINKFDGGKVPVWGEIYDHKKEYTNNLVYIPGRCGKKKIEKSKNEFFQDK